MTERDARPDMAVSREEPWWMVVTQLESGDYATTTVDAPDEEQAEAEGGRIIAAGEVTGEFEVRHARGPFPKAPGEAAPKVRPNGCGGCGLRCWGGGEPPCPHVTWFERESETEADVCWRCIQCGTRTYMPKEGPA